ncbi:occludin/ELL domain-containing protein 1 [Oryzias melastigma]|uniref:MARVEL domain containing 2-like n=1 Tax=Oryzias melastigma TaxID=30732 RepID=A0A3B3D492_ORYME|nr:occludin/ELL domain-containing protein 1 [Oryzias melastigma]XP_024129063.1 occludin/ELL domain-containing protein 1 [Oryzias melastigma]
MSSKNTKFNLQEDGSEIRSSSPRRTSFRDPAAPVWVTHSPTPDHPIDHSDGDSDSTSHTQENQKISKKEGVTRRLKSFIPESWGVLSRKSRKQSQPESSKTVIPDLPNGTRVSPPVSPLLKPRNWDESLASSSQSSRKPLLRESPLDDPFFLSLQEDSLLTSIHPTEYYAEKLEVYNMKYSYLKSWPGLLRLLAGLQLLFGGMVFACVIAYIQKDSEWSNSYGHYSGAFNNGFGPSSYSYGGPMTPFILAVAGLSWILTLCLLVVGLTMYYRTILLDSPWWPLTEAFLNVALFLLYMAAGIVYLNDLNRGGLCYMTIGVNPIMSNLCRVDGGQMAGTAFIFINMTMYLGSFLVCLKMWRHEAARKERTEMKGDSHKSIPLTSQTKRISFPNEPDEVLKKANSFPSESSSEVQKNSVSQSGAAKSSYVPRVHVIADYILKYPAIRCVEERDEYRAVFNDQYQEYKELHSDITATLNKFRELDAVMEQLPKRGKSLEDQERIKSILKKYHEKKNDPTFLEKKERCDYLKAKLRHIKNRIQTFDQETAVSMDTQQSRTTKRQNK